MNSPSHSIHPLFLLPDSDQEIIESALQSLKLKDHPLRSLQIYNIHGPSGTLESDSYSRLQILRSAAGYYIGTIYIDRDHLFESPGSRDTSYFQNLDQAVRAFTYMTQLAISGNSSYPFDLAQWERTLTVEFKHSVKYLYQPAH